MAKGSFVDQLGRAVALDAPARRVVSLVPSHTELLAELGLDAEVVGITDYCVRPADWRGRKARVGGPKRIDAARIEAAAPDLVLADREENDRAQVEALARRRAVWTSDVRSLDDALTMIGLVGPLVGRAPRADEMAAEIAARFAELAARRASRGGRPRRAAYLVWRGPLMAAATGTFIDAMLRACGFVNVFDAARGRYPTIAPEELRAAAPELILLPSEPYPFAEADAAEFRALCPGAAAVAVDGEMFCWPGARLLRAPAYFEDLAASL